MVGHTGRKNLAHTNMTHRTQYMRCSKALTGAHDIVPRLVGGYTTTHQHATPPTAAHGERTTRRASDVSHVLPPHFPPSWISPRLTLRSVCGARCWAPTPAHENSMKHGSMEKNCRSRISIAPRHPQPHRCCGTNMPRRCAVPHVRLPRRNGRDAGPSAPHRYRRSSPLSHCGRAISAMLWACMDSHARRRICVSSPPHTSRRSKPRC